ncbi:YhcN/YlaJ family sporulation lipoprotein [Shouchella lonarensis]|nr:YhcN/YlaJ family sporulation lipoprotein [Shouchella lonarensis]
MTLSVLCATVLVSSLTACGNTTGMESQRTRTQMDERIVDGDRAYPYDYNAGYKRNRIQNNQGTSKYSRTIRDDVGMNTSRTRAYQYKNGASDGIRAKVIPEERGITGNNRVGMVDEDGFINRMGRRDNRGMMFQGQGYNKRGHHRATQRVNETPLQYHRDYYGKEVRRITEEVEKIDGVIEARVMIHGNDVVVGYVPDDGDDGVHARVKAEVARLVGEDKNVTVTSDDYAFSTLRKMDDQLRSGTAFEEMEDTFTDMLDDMRDMLRQPMR